MRARSLLALGPAPARGGRRRACARAATTPRRWRRREREAEAANAPLRAARTRRRARATSDADRARAEAEALAARIEAAEADLTAAERRIAIIAALQAAQRARLAARQGPLVRLTAALQTMTRRPAALALVQPGSVRDAVHVRSLLAATLPEIRRRTAALRAEVERRQRPARAAPKARAPAWSPAATALRERRVALAALRERAARPLAAAGRPRADPVRPRPRLRRGGARRSARRSARRADQARLRRQPRAPARPDRRARRSGAPTGAGERLPYSLPVEGRLLTGVGEISDGGVHARGLTFETAAGRAGDRARPAAGSSMPRRSAATAMS